MASADDLALRLMQLEERYAFQEAEINTLSVRLIEQQQQIDAILLLQTQLQAQLQALEEKDAVAASALLHERPPHY